MDSPGTVMLLHNIGIYQEGTGESSSASDSFSKSGRINGNTQYPRAVRTPMGFPIWA